MLRLVFLMVALCHNTSVISQAGSNQSVRSTSKNNPGLENLQDSQRDSLVVWQERVVLHLDKRNLRPNDHIFFKAYILTGPEQLRVSASDVLKVELLDENGILAQSQYHKIREGSSEGSLEIPRKLKEGAYYFRAYTRWMLNYGPEKFAIKRIEINDTKNVKQSGKPINGITFFPEGGHLVAGIVNSVAVAYDGKLLLNLPVYNSKDEVVASVKNYGMGIGTFLITPEKGERYYIKLEGNRRIPLPEVQERGYSIQVNNLGNEKLHLKIEATTEVALTPTFLRGIANGITFFETKVDFEKESATEIDIPKENLPKGILFLELVDEFNQVWASRPIYIDNEGLLIQVEREAETRGNEILRVRVTDSNGLPVQTQLSIGLRGQMITDSKALETSSTIPEKSIRNQRFLNDLKVLTKQSSEDFQSSANKDVPDEIRYAFQNGLEFFGQAYDLNNTLLSNTKIQLLISSDDNVIVEEAETNEEGLFSLSGLQLKGEVTIVFRTVGAETKTKLVKVIPYEYEIPSLAIGNPKQRPVTRKSKQILPTIPAIDFFEKSDEEGRIALDEITVKATKPLRRTSPTIYNIEPSRVVYQDAKRPRTIPQLFLNIPGVQVVGLGSLSPSINLPRTAGSGPVVWVIDGFPMAPSTSMVDIVNLLSYADIERIELLLGGDASMYGTRAAAGVILIYTRSGSEAEYLKRAGAQLTFQGFHESISFEEYRKANYRKRKNAKDSPTTLYWDPALTTNANGEAIIRLSSSIDYNRINIHANSITEKGARGSLKTTF
ncbi:MAG: Plug domain-containing protein [Eudoraea sp.]|nr:Plug domain-containing protein [Eudoraea sp.]